MRSGKGTTRGEVRCPPVGVVGRRPSGKGKDRGRGRGRGNTQRRCGEKCHTVRPK